MLKHQAVRLFIITSGIILAIYSYYHGDWTYLAILVVFWLLLLVWGSFDIRLGYFTKTHFSNRNEKELKVAITFDDGPTEFTCQALELLKKYNVKATFFCIGKQIEKHPDIFQRIIEDGHLVGNHSYSHPKKFGFLSTQEVVDEIQKNDQVIVEMVGKKVAFFRPPFGVTNPSIHRAIQRTGHQVIGWSIRSLDTAKEDELKIVKRVERKMHPGGVILLHDTSQKSIHALEKILKVILEKKYTVIPLDKLLDLQAYLP